MTLFPLNLRDLRIACDEPVVKINYKKHEEKQDRSNQDWYWLNSRISRMTKIIKMIFWLVGHKKLVVIKITAN